MKGFFTKKRIIIGSIVLVAAVLLTGGIIVYAQLQHAIQNPKAMFNNQTPTPVATQEPTPEPTVEPTLSSSPTATPAPTPTPTIDPYEKLLSQADLSLMKNTVNILLVGVDYATERDHNKKQYVGKYFNSDVMMVLAINFDKNKVDMISVPRDSYAKIANIDGIYKLNFALQAGGGINDKGFTNVCKSVEGVLGGIPVNYYIAVTMPVVKELTDMVGGVDYDIDVNFKMMGREYKKGMQHLNGQAVLDYCRARKNMSQGGDLNRVNRQKKVLMAVFKKLQSNATILDVPQTLISMNGKVHTNMNFSQLAAIAAFGKKLPTENITMRTIPGYYMNIFNKNYVLINQTKRIELIKEVYGVTVDRDYRHTPEVAKLQWAYMQGDSWVKKIDKILKKDAALGDKKKFTDAAQLAQMQSLMQNTKACLAKYKSVATKKAKPTAKTSQVDEMTNSINALKAFATPMLAKGGYQINWFVDVYKPGQMRMKE